MPYRLNAITGELDLVEDVSSFVVGPASSTDNAIARFDGTTGKLIQNSVVLIDDAGVVTGATQLNVDNIRIDGNTISSTDTNGDITLSPDGTGIVISNSSIRLPNDTYIVGRNNANTADINMFKVDTADQIDAGTTIVTRSIFPLTDSFYNLGTTGSRYLTGWFDDITITNTGTFSSVVTPGITAPATFNMNINAATGFNYNTNLGDNAGANVFNINNNSGTAQMRVNSLGVITLATWNGDTITEAYGGTNQTTYATGDILYASASNTLSKLGIASDGDVLTIASGLPSWSTPLTESTNFLATANAQTNVTGDNTQYTVLFANEIFDTGGDFASPTFTAPATGKYLICVTLNISGIQSGTSTEVDVDLITSNRNYRFEGVFDGGTGLSYTNFNATGSVIADMDASDTATVRMQVNGGSKVVDINANTSTFSAVRIG